MANKMLTMFFRASPKTQQAFLSMAIRQMSSQAEALSKIGNRDIVGYGWNGQPSYQDRVDYPMPAVRFRENTPDVMVSS